MDKEDFLLKQIDEFREKAKQLQALLVTKEDKVQELQNIVDEREEGCKEAFCFARKVHETQMKEKKKQKNCSMF